MDISTFFESKIFISIASLLGGIIVTIITQHLLNRRGLFTYHVFHNRVGLSTEDAIYGSVKVTWNENPVAHLYLSTIELTNQSMKDFESVVVRAFSNNTKLLSQRTEIVGTTRLIDFTEEFKNIIAVAAGNEPTEAQFHLFSSQREYFVPTINRGQMLRFQFLNAAISEDQPEIWLDVLHKGVKCKFRVARNLFLGVPQPEAVLAGTLVGFVAVSFVIAYAESVPFAAILPFFLGWLVLLPGAFTVRAFRKVRDWFAG